MASRYRYKLAFLDKVMNSHQEFGVAGLGCPSCMSLYDNQFFLLVRTASISLSYPNSWDSPNRLVRPQ